MKIKNLLVLATMVVSVGSVGVLYADIEGKIINSCNEDMEWRGTVGEGCMPIVPILDKLINIPFLKNENYFYYLDKPGKHCVITFSHAGKHGSCAPWTVGGDGILAGTRSAIGDYKCPFNCEKKDGKKWYCEFEAIR